MGSGKKALASVTLHLSPPGPSLLPPIWYMFTILFGFRSKKVGGGTGGRTDTSASHHSSKTLKAKLVVIAAATSCLLTVFLVLG